MQLNDQDFIAKVEGYTAIMRAPADPMKTPEEIKALAEEILAFSRLNSKPSILERGSQAKLAYVNFKRELYRQLYSVGDAGRGHVLH